MNNKKSKLFFKSSQLGLMLSDELTRGQFLFDYGYGFGAQVFKTIDKAIKVVEPWAEKRIIKLQRDIKEYEKFLKYIKKIKGE